MTEFLLYFEVNIICIAVLAIIGFNISRSEYSPGRRPKVMLHLIYSTIGFYILDILGGYERQYNLQAKHEIVFVLTALYFLLFALSAYLWFFYSEILHNKSFFDNARGHVLLAIPLFVLTVLFIASYFTGWVFRVTPDEGYSRGPLFPLQAAVAFSYVLAAGVRCVYYAGKKRKSSMHDNLIAFANYSFLTLICGITQFLIGEFPIMIIGNTISILLLYLRYLRNMISLDPLTQIPNRRRLLYDTVEAEKDLRPNEKLYFLFIDVDGFKAINDKYGHLEGDRILASVSHTIRKFCKKNNCLCGRYGGDEFAVVQKLPRKREFDTPQLLCDQIAAKKITVDDIPITVSIGYAEFAVGDKIEDLIARADKSMYEAKKTKNSGGGYTPLRTHGKAH